MFGDMGVAVPVMFAAMFTDLCAIQRATNTQGTSGGNKPAWSAVTGLSSVPCLYSAKKGAERDSAGSVTAFTDFEILMPSEVGGVLNSVAPKDRIVVAARSPQPARTFEVVGQPLSESGLYLKCQVVLRN
jgi:hypothetical protein